MTPEEFALLANKFWGEDAIDKEDRRLKELPWLKFFDARLSHNGDVMRWEVGSAPLFEKWVNDQIQSALLWFAATTQVGLTTHGIDVFFNWGAENDPQINLPWEEFFKSCSFDQEEFETLIKAMTKAYKSSKNRRKRRAA